jgi:hypothetical protein
MITPPFETYFGELWESFWCTGRTLVEQEVFGKVSSTVREGCTGEWGLEGQDVTAELSDLSIVDSKSSS